MGIDKHDEPDTSIARVAPGTTTKRTRRAQRRLGPPELKITDRPVLSMRMACQLADCSRSTIVRSPLVPVGRRGRTLFFSTDDVLAWLRGGLASRPSVKVGAAADKRKGATSASDESIDRVRRLGRNAVQS